MRWSILLTSIVLTGCFDPSDPAGGERPLGTGSSSSGSADGSVTSNQTDATSPTDPTAPTAPTDGSDTTNATDPTASTDPTQDTDDPSQCTCAIAAPNNWNGPLVIGRGDDLPECIGAFTGSQLDTVTDVAGDPATCGCSCGVAQVDCGDLTLLYRQSCGQPVGTELFAQPDTCHDNTPQQNSTNPFFTPVPDTQACPPSPTVEVPPGSSTGVRLCGGTFEQAECGPGEQCVAAVPDGFEPRLCIARSGVHDCPPAYPEQEVVFNDIADNRDCTACDCTPDEAFECSSTLQLHTGDTCDDPSGTVDTDQCVGSWGSFMFSPPTVTGSCTPSDSTAIGEAVGAEPTTICCD